MTQNLICFPNVLDSTMASHALQFLPHTKPLHLGLNHQIPQIMNPSLPRIHNVSHHKFFSTQCASNSNSVPQNDLPNPNSDSNTDGEAEGFQIQKRRKSVIIQDRKSRVGLVKPEPQNFEIGWKRTKEIKLEKPKGYVIADFLEKLDFLMGREYGSEELLAKTGEIVAERAREEAEILREEGAVEDRLITELFRVLKLMEMDLAMVKAAVKEETLKERLEQAKARCRIMYHKLEAGVVHASMANIREACIIYSTRNDELIIAAQWKLGLQLTQTSS